MPNKRVGTLTNLSNLTRKEQILLYLRARKGEWVNGTELATEEVGGSEGLRRLRDLRIDGYSIQQRRHPDSDRDIWQYRLVEAEVIPLREHRPVQETKRLVFGLNRYCEQCHGKGIKHGAECQICAGRGWI